MTRDSINAGDNMRASRGDAGVKCRLSDTMPELPKYESADSDLRCSRIVSASLHAISLPH